MGNLNRLDVICTIKVKSHKSHLHTQNAFCSVKMTMTTNDNDDGPSEILIEFSFFYFVTLKTRLVLVVVIVLWVPHFFWRERYDTQEGSFESRLCACLSDSHFRFACVIMPRHIIEDLLPRPATQWCNEMTAPSGDSEPVPILLRASAGCCLLYFVVAGPPTHLIHSLHPIRQNVFLCFLLKSDFLSSLLLLCCYFVSHSFAAAVFPSLSLFAVPASSYFILTSTAFALGLLLLLYLCFYFHSHFGSV